MAKWGEGGGSGERAGGKFRLGRGELDIGVISVGERGWVGRACALMKFMPSAVFPTCHRLFDL